MCFGSPSPALKLVPKEEYKDRVVENADMCIVDGEHFFVRGHIELPVKDSNDVFAWSVWVSLSDNSFDHMCDNWEKTGRENSESYFGWLSTSLPYEQDTLQIKTGVQSQPLGCVPQITVEQTEHPLSIEQHQGITMERVHEIVHEVLQK